MEKVWAEEVGDDDDNLSTPYVEPVYTKFTDVHGTFEIKWNPTDQFEESE
jgi:hypothetical protein